VPDRRPELEILCEDGPVIAVNKPAGIVVQGAPAGVANLADLVRDYLRTKYAKPGNVYLGVPHRLDRPVTGVVIFSRNSKGAARLAEQFATRVVQKTYLAILERPPEPPAGTLTDWLLRAGEEHENADDPRAPKVSVVTSEIPGAKQAILHYRTLATARGRALVEITLETGRMHQIRVQFASRGCPIVGDTQYGARSSWDGVEIRAATADDASRYHPIALHAWRLALKHPVRYDDLTITAPPPESWSRQGLSIPQSIRPA
jgi:23S rRNA pseudouridine1911/1915/1917 synthase